MIECVRPSWYVRLRYSVGRIISEAILVCHVHHIVSSGLDERRTETENGIPADVTEFRNDFPLTTNLLRPVGEAGALPECLRLAMAAREINNSVIDNRCDQCYAL